MRDLFTTLLLLASAATVLAQSALKPQIIEKSYKDVKKINGIGQLNCTVSHIGPNNKVQWLKIRENDQAYPEKVLTYDDTIVVPNDPIQSSKAGQLALKKYAIHKDIMPNDQVKFRLVIRNLIAEDGGKYKCRIVTDSSDSASQPAVIVELSVNVPPEISSAGTTNEQELEIGTNFTLFCTATGIPKPNIKWVRADGRVLPNGNQESRGEKYTISEIKASDRGVYRCVASNNVKPPDIYETRLKIRYSPYVKPEPDSVGQAENRQYRVELSCEVSGYPEPEVQWFRSVDGQRTKLKRDNKYEIKQATLHTAQTGSDEIKLNILIISNVRSNDYGYYYCVAENKVGKREGQIKLFETTECQGVHCKIDSLIGSSGEAITVTSLLVVSAILSAILL